jgi:tetratricopeptide (TPR) repeat protein
MKCPNCSTDSDGRFCPSCGTPLASAKCRACKAQLLPGARFCTQCGEAVAADGPASRLPWILAAAAIVALIVVLVRPAFERSPGPQTGGAGTAPFADAGTGGAPPPLTGTPREQADRLFNRIMQEREAGNTERATFFMPMAITAYEQAAPLDHDGLYHLSILQTAAGDYAGARANAERILADAPDHLLGLAAAAEAAGAAGDMQDARVFWQRFLDAFETEKDKPLQEYLDHARILPQYRQDALEVVGG